MPSMVHPGHGWHGEDNRRDHGRHLAGTEQHDHRHEIGHVRGRLHDVEHRRNDGCSPLRAGDPDAQSKAQHNSERHRNHDDGERLHGVTPQPHDGQVADTPGRKQGQLPAADPVPQNTGAGNNHHPGQRIQFLDADCVQNQSRQLEQASVKQDIIGQHDSPDRCNTKQAFLHANPPTQYCQSDQWTEYPEDRRKLLYLDAAIQDVLRPIQRLF